MYIILTKQTDVYFYLDGVVAFVKSLPVGTKIDGLSPKLTNPALSGIYGYDQYRTIKVESFGVQCFDAICVAANVYQSYSSEIPMLPPVNPKNIDFPEFLIYVRSVDENLPNYIKVLFKEGTFLTVRPSLGVAAPASINHTEAYVWHTAEDAKQVASDFATPGIELIVVQRAFKPV